MTREASQVIGEGGYDEGYASCPCFWGREPGSLLALLHKQLLSFKELKVLDAGCGEGKNAAYLAEQGASVLGVDISQLAIDHAKALWPLGERVSWLCADIRELVLPDESYDIVLAYGLLHCLPSPQAVAELTNRLKSATRLDGTHVICAFNSRSQDLSAHPGFRPSLISHDEYLELYSDWDVIVASDTDLTESHPHNGLVHTHSLTRMIVSRRHE